MADKLRVKAMERIPPRRPVCKLKSISANLCEHSPKQTRVGELWARLGERMFKQASLTRESFS